MTDLKGFQRFEQRFYSKHVSSSEEWPLLGMWEFFQIRHSSYQPLTFHWRYAA